MQITSFRLFLLIGLTFLAITVSAAIWAPAGASMVPLAWSLSLSLLCVAAGYYLIKLMIPMEPGPAAPTSGFGVIWSLSVAACLIAVSIYLSTGQTSPVFEAFRRLIDAGYVPDQSGLELRLSTASMPRWAQVIFEGARRMAFPLAAVLIVTGAVRFSWARAALLVVLGAFFVLSSGDRSVPMMYVFVIFGARVLLVGKSALFSKWALVAVIVGAGGFVGLKAVQYGELSGFNSTGNLEIAQVFGGLDPELLDQALTGKQPSARAQALAVKDEDITPFHRAFYAFRSLYERLALSPVTMALYAFNEYDDTNFQHWRSTRILSLIGIGRYVDPLDAPTSATHHDAFPATYIGDLWRQGGHLYIPIYSALLGMLLMALDRVFFLRGFTVWQPFILLAVSLLFYGNAVNATFFLLVAGSLAGMAFTRLAGQADSARAVA